MGLVPTDRGPVVKQGRTRRVRVGRLRVRRVTRQFSVSRRFPKLTASSTVKPIRS